jgi:hypothetical protein
MDLAGEEQQQFTRLTDKPGLVNNSLCRPVPYTFMRDFRDVRLTSRAVSE